MLQMQAACSQMQQDCASRNRSNSWTPRRATPATFDSYMPPEKCRPNAARQSSSYGPMNSSSPRWLRSWYFHY